METTNDKEVARAKALARVLDTAIGIPGTPLRIGVDAIIGLIPGAGDAIGAVLAGYIVLAAARSGASGATLVRMIGNVVLDTALGSVPVIGDIFDVFFKANVRNAALLERVSASPAAVDRSSRRLGVVWISVLVLALLGIATLGFLIARALWRLLVS